MLLLDQLWDDKVYFLVTIVANWCYQSSAEVVWRHNGKMYLLEGFEVIVAFLVCFVVLFKVIGKLKK